MELETSAGKREEMRSIAQDALRKSELRYRRLFETAQDGILILDAETGTITDANPFLLDLLGYPFEEMFGRHLWEIGEFKDVAASKAAFAVLQSTEYVRYENLPLQTRSGDRRQVEFVSNVYELKAKKSSSAISGRLARVWKQSRRPGTTARAWNLRMTPKIMFSPSFRMNCGLL